MRTAGCALLQTLPRKHNESEARSHGAHLRLLGQLIVTTETPVGVPRDRGSPRCQSDSRQAVGDSGGASRRSARGGRRSLSLWLLMLSGSYYCPLSVHSFPPRGSSAGGETTALLLSNRALILSEAPACTTTGRPSENRRKLPLTETAEDGGEGPSVPATSEDPHTAPRPPPAGVRAPFPHSTPVADCSPALQVIS